MDLLCPVSGILCRLTTALLLALCIPLSVSAGSEFIAVAYHDVVDQRGELSYDAITLDHLIDQFEWLKLNDYHPVTIDDLKAAQDGSRPLPEKAILLCWDDAYASFYTHVLPLLKAYQYPAVLALVSNWITPAAGEMVQYGKKLVPRHTFMSWEQLQEAADSGLVEIASHSSNLHTDLLADSSGDRLPAAIARRYDPASNSYETEPQFRQRIHNDLQASSDLILEHLGLRPRVLVWPYGRYNQAALETAREVGMSITLTLNPIPGNSDHLHAIGRIYPTRNPDLGTFRSYLESEIRPPVNHFFRVNSQDLLEPSATEEKHFSIFLNRVKDLDPNMVIIDPVVEDNHIRKALFTNHRFPVAQDRLNRLSWHTGKRAETSVFLWLSSSLFTAEDGETRESINRFFYDMGKSAPGQGLVVNLPELIPPLLTLPEMKSATATEVPFWNPDLRRRARQAVLNRAGDNPGITEFIQALESFQQWQPFQEIGFVLPIDHFLSMEREEFTTMLSLFDFLLIDTEKNSLPRLSSSLRAQVKLLQETGYLQKCAFLLSTEDRGKLVARDLQQLPTLNIINWGYQFDDFLEGVPQAAVIRPLLSKGVFPYPLRH